MVSLYWLAFPLNWIISANPNSRFRTTIVASVSIGSTIAVALVVNTISERTLSHRTGYDAENALGIFVRNPLVVVLISPLVLACCDDDYVPLSSEGAVAASVISPSLLVESLLGPVGLGILVRRARTR